MNIHTQNLPASNSGRHVCIMGLCNFSFVLQDLIDRINSFSENSFSVELTFYWLLTLHVTSFSDENRQLEWRCVNLQGAIREESHRSVLNMKISIHLKKGWFSYVRVSLKQEEHHIYIAQLSSIPLNKMTHYSKKWTTAIGVLKKIYCL